MIRTGAGLSVSVVVCVCVMPIYHMKIWYFYITQVCFHPSTGWRVCVQLFFCAAGCDAAAWHQTPLL